MASKSEIHQTVLNFTDNVAEVLEKQDKRIRAKFRQSEFGNKFYDYFWQGLYTWSVTEPILQFIIFTELSDKYQIYPEFAGYETSERLDLSLFIDHIDELDDSMIGEVGIELKWAYTTKEGKFNQNSLNTMESDFRKIKNVLCDHKYLMHFAVSDTNLDNNISILNRQVKEAMDGRILRYYYPKLVKVASFPTYPDYSQDDKKWFSILLWQVIRKAGI